jgi:hypothetical protein
MKLKKYKVLKKTPKPIMNAGRMVMLEPDKIVYLKYEKQVEVLLTQGFIKEIMESESLPKSEEIKPKPEHSKKKKQKNKNKHKSSDFPKEDAEDQSTQE